MVGLVAMKERRFCVQHDFRALTFQYQRIPIPIESVGFETRAGVGARDRGLLRGGLGARSSGSGVQLYSRGGS